jgi:hypothetical protein
MVLRIAARQCEQEDLVLKFALNGRDVAVDAPPDAPLLFVLNNDLDQHGGKFGAACRNAVRAPSSSMESRSGPVRCPLRLP